MPTIREVTTPGGIKGAMTAALPGDTIKVGPGEYYEVNLYNVLKASTVFVELDPGAILKGLIIQGGGGFAISGGTIMINTALGRDSAVSFSKCKNVSLKNSTVRGRLAATPEEIRTINGVGVTIVDATDTTISGCDFAYSQYGVSHQRCVRTNITDNTFHDIRADGVRGTSGYLNIDRNTFTNFFRGLEASGAGEHFDAIQLWTRATDGGLTDINIRDNKMFRGEGDNMASIQIGDEADRNATGIWTAIKYGYKNLVITGNILAGGGHPINVEGAIDPLIAYNILGADNTAIYPDIQVVHGVGGRVVGNVTPAPTQPYRALAAITLDDNIRDATLVSTTGDYSRVNFWAGILEGMKRWNTLLSKPA